MSKKEMSIKKDRKSVDNNSTMLFISVVLLSSLLVQCSGAEQRSKYISFLKKSDKSPIMREHMLERSDFIVTQCIDNYVY